MSGVVAQAHEARFQFLRFAIVGLTANLILYVVYLLLSRLGLGPKLSATITFALGVVQTFCFNRSWTFRDHGDRVPTFLRYVAMYFAAYLLNMAALYALVDKAGLSHEAVQGGMVLTLGVLLFAAQKWFVFRAQALPK